MSFQKKDIKDGINNLSLNVPGDPNKPGKVPESHVLVEKIVKLQKTLAKKQEKVEFMEEHISTMLEEIKKKNKLIQNYILKLESGALVSSQMDENKVCKKLQSNNNKPFKVRLRLIYIEGIVFSNQKCLKQENVTNEVKSPLAFYRLSTHDFIIFVLKISLAS